MSHLTQATDGVIQFDAIFYFAITYIKPHDKENIYHDAFATG